MTDTGATNNGEVRPGNEAGGGHATVECDVEVEERGIGRVISAAGSAFGYAQRRAQAGEEMVDVKVVSRAQQKTYVTGSVPRRLVETVVQGVLGKAIAAARADEALLGLLEALKKGSDEELAAVLAA